MSDGFCSEKSLKRKRRRLFFKVKMFTRLKLLGDVSSFSLASHLLFLHLPVILPLCIPNVSVCLALKLFCLDPFPTFLPICYVVFLSVNSLFSRFDFCSTKRKLLPIMTTAAELMTMTSNSKCYITVWKVKKKRWMKWILPEKAFVSLFYLAGNVSKWRICQWFLQQVTNYVQDREELNLIHPAKKLLQSCPECVCLRESRWPSHTVSASPARPDLYRCLNPRCCRPSHPPRCVALSVVVFPAMFIMWWKDCPGDALNVFVINS